MTDRTRDVLLFLAAAAIVWLTYHLDYIFFGWAPPF